MVASGGALRVHEPPSPRHAGPIELVCEIADSYSGSAEGVPPPRTLARAGRRGYLSAMHEKGPASQINALHARAVRGDVLSEERLFEELLVRFLYIANQRVWDAAEVEDVVQDALAAVHREYREVSIRESFAAWAHRVLDNRIRGHVQKKVRRDRIREERAGNPGGFAHRAPDPDLRRRLLDCLRRLGRWSVKYARALNLSHQGYRTDEICERLGITSNHLYVILSRARSMLRACLETGRIR